MSSLSLCGPRAGGRRIRRSANPHPKMSAMRRSAWNRHLGTLADPADQTFSSTRAKLWLARSCGLSTPIIDKRLTPLDRRRQESECLVITPSQYVSYSGGLGSEDSPPLYRLWLGVMKDRGLRRSRPIACLAKLPVYRIPCEDSGCGLAWSPTGWQHDH